MPEQRAKIILIAVVAAGLMAASLLIWAAIYFKDNYGYWNGVDGIVRNTSTPEFADQPVVRVVKDEYQKPTEPDRGNISKTAHDEFKNCGGDDQIKQILLDIRKVLPPGASEKKTTVTPEGKSYSYSVEEVATGIYEIHCLT